MKEESADDRNSRRLAYFFFASLTMMVLGIAQAVSWAVRESARQSVACVQAGGEWFDEACRRKR